MKIIDEWRQEDYENGKKEGKEEEKINTAKNMLKENYTIKQIATITQLNSFTRLSQNIIKSTIFL